MECRHIQSSDHQYLGMKLRNIRKRGPFLNKVKLIMPDIVKASDCWRLHKLFLVLVFLPYIIYILCWAGCRTMWKHMIVGASYQLFFLFLVIYGAPAHIARFSLPSPCATYSAIDGRGITLTAVSVIPGNAYNPLCALNLNLYSLLLCPRVLLLRIRAD